MAVQVSAPGSLKVPAPVNGVSSSTVASDPAAAVGATLLTVTATVSEPVPPRPSVTVTVTV